MYVYIYIYIYIYIHTYIKKQHIKSPDPPPPCGLRGAAGPRRRRLVEPAREGGGYR